MKATIAVAIARLHTIAANALSQSTARTEADLLEVCNLLEGAMTGRPVHSHVLSARPMTPGVEVTRLPRDGETITLMTRVDGPGYACVSALGTSDTLATSTDPRALVRWAHRFANSCVQEPGILVAIERGGR